MAEDWKLLQSYATEGSEDAFRTIVERYVALVYSAALRQTRSPELAEDVTQAVFVVLARKAHSIRPGTILVGWLFRTTRFAAARAVRAEQRRRLREQEAAHMNLEPDAAAPWKEIEPYLDEALARLGETDRHAVLLRFFARKELKEVGAAIGSSEEAAKKRVSRALEKLRGYLSARGLPISASTLGLALMENAVQTAPNGLAGSVAAAIATGTGSAVTLGIGTIKAMFCAKLKTAATGLGIIISLAGTGLLMLRPEATLLANSPRNASPLESFKAFVAHPPFIEEFVCEIRYPSSNRTNFYSGKWQGKEFLLGVSSNRWHSITGAPPGRLTMLYGQSKDIAWTVFSHDRTAKVWNLPKDGLESESNEVAIATGIAQIDIDRLLSFGLEHLPCGTVKWQGNTFQETNLQRQVVVAGQIHTNKGGAVSRIDMTLSHYSQAKEQGITPRIYHWRLRYEYSSEQTNGFPIVIKRLVVKPDGEEFLRDEIRFLSLKKAEKRMPPETFDYTPYLFTNSTVLHAIGDSFYNSRGIKAENFPAFKEGEHPLDSLLN